MRHCRISQAFDLKSASELCILFVIVFNSCNSVRADAISDVDSVLRQAQKESAEDSYTEAENHFRMAITQSVRNIGGMSSSSAKTCRAYADFLMNRGRFSDAEHYLQRALVISSGFAGAAYDHEGEFQNTRQFVSDSLQNPARLAGSLDLADVFSDFADLYSRQGKYSDAERMLKRCVQIYESAGQGAGNVLNYSADAPRLLAEHQRSLAQVYYKEGNVLDAETAFKAYVETVRKDKGASPELADALNHLSMFYKSQNRSSESDAAAVEAGELRNRFH